METGNNWLNRTDLDFYFSSGSYGNESGEKLLRFEITNTHITFALLIPRLGIVSEVFNKYYTNLNSVVSFNKVIFDIINKYNLHNKDPYLVEIFWINKNYVLVPELKINELTAKEIYHSHNLISPQFSKFFCERIVKDISIIYAIPQSNLILLNKYFKKISFSHYVHRTLQFIFKNINKLSLNSNFFSINRKGNLYYLSLLIDGELRFFNVFELSQDLSLIKVVENLFFALQIKTTNFPLIIEGNFNLEDSNISNLRELFPQTHVIKRDLHFKYPKEMEVFQPHLFSSIFTSPDLIYSNEYY